VLFKGSVIAGKLKERITLLEDDEMCSSGKGVLEVFHKGGQWNLPDLVPSCGTA
jgi:hypothetical protein